MRDRNKILGLVTIAGLAAASAAWPLGCAKSGEDCASRGLPDGCTSGTGGTGGVGAGGTSAGGGGTSAGGGGTGGTNTGGSNGMPEVCASRRAGDAADQAALGLDAKSGQVLVGGAFDGTISFGAAQHPSVATSTFVAVLDAATLAPSWSRALQAGHLASVLDASGDVIVAANYATGAMIDLGCGALDPAKGFVLARLAKSTGACVYAKTFVAPFVSAHLAVAGNGDVILAGVTDPGTSGVDLGADGLLPVHGKQDLAVARFDATGTTLWSRSYGGVEDDAVAGIAVDPTTGAVTLVGDFEGSIDFATGGNALDGGGSRAVFAAQLDKNGAAAWARALNGPSVDVAAGIARLPSGDTVISGRFLTSLDVKTTMLTTTSSVGGFLVSLDSKGDSAWAKSIDSLGEAAVAAMTAGNSGIAVTGTVVIDASTTRLYVARFGLDGAPISETTFGGTGVTRGTGLSFDGTGLDVAGVFDGALDLGESSLTSAGKNDVFVLRLCL